MRLSAFNLYLPGFPRDGTTLVHNTFSGGFAELADDALAALRRADAGAPLSDEERAQIDLDLFDESVGILVESRAAEELAYRAWFESLREQTAELSAIVSTTLSCNLDCTYCCQADILDGSTMSAEVGASTADWLAGRAAAIGASRVRVSFVGGEPLLQPRRLEQIVADLRARLGARVPLTFDLITNGVFLTPELVTRWLPIGLVGAQVTLDGDASTHSRSRRSKKGAPDSFPTIFRNVVACARLVPVSIRGNYQPDTVHGFPALVSALREAGLAPGTRIRFHPALEALGAPEGSGSGSCTWAGSTPETMFALGDEVLRAGFEPGDAGNAGPCGFHRANHFAIDPRGRIYACPGFLDHSEWAIGDVRGGLTERFAHTSGLDPQAACGDCSHRPECAGGCLASKWIKEGREEGVNCELEFFEGQKERIITRRYGRAVGVTPEEALAHVSAANISAREDRGTAKGQSAVVRMDDRIALRVLAA